MKKSRRRSILGLALTTAALALAVSAANASAARFVISATGALEGKQTSTQVFTNDLGTFTCTGAVTSGSITSTDFTILEPKLTYSGCSGVAFGFKFTSTPISAAQFRIHANGEQDLLNTVTISIPGLACSVTYAPQSGLKSITYTNKYPKVEASSSLSGLSYTSSGGCGASGSNGTLTGSSLIERSGGGSIQWLA